MPTKSKIQEMADEEATRAEAESPDDEEGEPQPQPPSPTPDEDEEGEAADEGEALAEPLSMEALGRALEYEGKRHADALAAIFGDDFANFEECPVCHLLGVISPESPRMDDSTMQCPRCAGYGKIVTEAVNENRFRQCPDCLGNGYVPRPVAPPPAAPQMTGYTQPPPPSGPYNAPAAGAPQPVAPIPPMPVYDPASNTWQVPQGNGGYAAPAPVAPTPSAT